MSARSVTVVVPTLGGGSARRGCSSRWPRKRDHQTIVVDNGSPGGARAPRACSNEGVEVCGSRATRATRGPSTSGPREPTARSWCWSTTTASATAGSSCAGRPDRPRRRGRDGGGGDARLGAIPSASTAPGWSSTAPCWSSTTSTASRSRVLDRRGRGPDRALGGGRRASTARRSVTRAVSTSGCSPTGRTSTSSCDCGGTAIAARSRPGARRSRALGQPRSGSPQKNYLMGFGRGYVLRKWGVRRGARRLAVIVREGVICVGQAVFDRNVAGLRGRLAGYRAAAAEQPHPAELPQPAATALVAEPAPARRRRAAAARALAGADLARPMQRARRVSHRRHQRPIALARGRAPLAVGAGTARRRRPRTGQRAELLGGIGGAIELALRGADPTPTRTTAAGRARTDGRRGAGGFERVIRDRRPDLVVAVTSMLPTVSIAARLERVPVLVYCGELYDRGFGVGPVRALAGRAAGRVTDGSRADHRLLGDRRAPVRRVRGSERSRSSTRRSAIATPVATERRSERARDRRRKRRCWPRSAT